MKLPANPYTILCAHTAATLPADPKQQRELLEALIDVMEHAHPCRAGIEELLRHVHAVERRERAHLALKDEFAKLLKAPADHLVDLARN